MKFQIFEGFIDILRGHSQSEIDSMETGLIIAVKKYEFGKGKIWSR